jgi:hypothetical protein
MMLDVFTDPSMPFFKFGDLIFLEKIDTGSWTKFIRERFSATGKIISVVQAELIVKVADNHPYYVQQLSQQVWLRTKVKCSDEIVHQAHSSLIEQLSLLFATITDALTNNQINFMKAVVAGEKALSSTDVLTRYHLTNSSNVSRSRQALIEKDILDNMEGILSFQDPMYRSWLEKDFFSSRRDGL